MLTSVSRVVVAYLRVLAAQLYVSARTCVRDRSRLYAHAIANTRAPYATTAANVSVCMPQGVWTLAYVPAPMHTYATLLRICRHSYLSVRACTPERSRMHTYSVPVA